MVKKLFENWRKYTTLNERINSLDPDTGKRFITDMLTEISDEDHNIPIPKEELQKIKRWGSLEGNPNFLGSGSKGSAYKFGDKVLKITNDANEARAATLLIGKDHPNVYKIYDVARRKQEHLDRSGGAFKDLPFVIVYEFLDYPNKAMLEAAQRIYGFVKNEAQTSFYNWDSSYLQEARYLLNKLASTAMEIPEILGEPVRKYYPVKDKIDELGEKLEWTPEQKNIFSVFYGSSLDGMSAKDINSPAAIKKYAQENIKNPKHEYFHQLALGLTYLNDNDIIFDDLKTSNIMEKEHEAAIIDVGYSTVKSDVKIPELS